MQQNKRVVSFLLLFALIFCPLILTAQVNAPVKKFSRGVIIKKDRKRFRGVNLIFDSQALTFKDRRTQQPMTISLKEIKYVRARTGNYAGEGALVGGALFFLSALSAILDAESDPYTTVENKGQVLGIMTAIGFGGGLIIGAMFPKEKIVFKHGRLVEQLPPPDQQKKAPQFAAQLRF